jgi:hypothetical protein
MSPRRAGTDSPFAATSDPDAAPYETLARMVERELELIGEGRFDELAAVKSERAALIDRLPATPPACARPALQRAVLMHKRLEIEIVRRREWLVLEFAKTERVRRTAHGYAPPRRQRVHVETSA